MVPKQYKRGIVDEYSFRAVLFRMVPKLTVPKAELWNGFRAVLFRMVPKHGNSSI